MIDATKDEMDAIRAMSDADLLAQLNAFDPYDDEFRRRFIALTAERDALAEQNKNLGDMVHQRGNTIASLRRDLKKAKIERDALADDLDAMRRTIAPIHKLREERNAEKARADALAEKLAKAVELISEKPILATYEDHVQWKKTTLAAIQEDGNDG